MVSDAKGRRRPVAQLPSRDRGQSPLPRRPRCRPTESKGVAALDALCRPRTNRGRSVARFNPLNRLRRPVSAATRTFPFAAARWRALAAAPGGHDRRFGVEPICRVLTVALNSCNYASPLQRPSNAPPKTRRAPRSADTQVTVDGTSPGRHCTHRRRIPVRYGPASKSSGLGDRAQGVTKPVASTMMAVEWPSGQDDAPSVTCSPRRAPATTYRSPRSGVGCTQRWCAG